MPLEFPAFPDLPQHTMTVPIGGVLYVATFTWRERLGSWYLDLRSQDGTDLVRGRRLTPGWGPLLGLLIPGAPEGLLWVRGPDAFAQADLGGELLLLHYAADELPQAASDPEAPLVVKLV